LRRREEETRLLSCSFLSALAKERKQHTWTPAGTVDLDSPVSLSFLTDSSLSLFSAPLRPQLTTSCSSLSGCSVLWNRDLYGSLFSSTECSTQLSQHLLHSTPHTVTVMSTHHSPGLSCSVCPKATVQVAVFPACDHWSLLRRQRQHYSPVVRLCGDRRIINKWIKSCNSLSHHRSYWTT
jgi:hypothetical protein